MHSSIHASPSLEQLKNLETVYETAIEKSERWGGGAGGGEGNWLGIPELEEIIQRFKNCSIYYLTKKGTQGLMLSKPTLGVKSSPGRLRNTFVLVQSLSLGQLFVTSWATALHASLSFTISQSLLKLMSNQSVMLSNHLILCHLLHLLPSVFPSIRVFSSESGLCIRWPKYWSFSFSISLSNEY